MVCRLVQDQNVNARVDQLSESQPALLTARKISDVLVNVVTGKQKLRQERTQLTRSSSRRSNTTQLHDDLVAIVEIVELLCVVSNLNFSAPTNFTTEWRNLVQY